MPVVIPAHINTVPVLGSAVQDWSSCIPSLIELLEHIDQPGHGHGRPPIVVSFSVSPVDQDLIVSIPHNSSGRQGLVQNLLVRGIALVHFSPLHARNCPIRYVAVHRGFFFCFLRAGERNEKWHGHNRAHCDNSPQLLLHISSLFFRSGTGSVAYPVRRKCTPVSKAQQKYSHGTELA